MKKILLTLLLLALPVSVTWGHLNGDHRCNLIMCRVDCDHTIDSLQAVIAGLDCIDTVWVYKQQIPIVRYEIDTIIMCPSDWVTSYYIDSTRYLDSCLQYDVYVGGGISSPQYKNIWVP